MIKEKIFYADQIKDIINDEFIFLEAAPWYRLYKRKADSSFWRLDEFEKYQIQFFVYIEDYKNWKDFDATNLQMELLKKTRGTTEKQCAWDLCTNKALQDLVFCERHAYLEMGVRR